jgi:hypothetical protein
MSKAFEPAYTAFATESSRDGSLGMVEFLELLGGALVELKLALVLLLNMP